MLSGSINIARLDCSGMRGASAWTAGAAGVAVGLGLAPVVPPAVGLVASTLVAVVAMRFVDDRPRYELAGTVYLFGFGLGIVATEPGGGYGQTTLVALFVFGILSAALVLVDAAIDRGVDRAFETLDSRFGGENTDEQKLEAALSAGAGTVKVVRTVLRVSRNLLRYVLFAVLGLVGIVLNTAGVQVSVPLVVIDHRLDVVMMVVVGTVITVFHACDFVAGVLYTARTSVDEGRELTDQMRDSAATRRGDRQAPAGSGETGSDSPGKQDTATNRSADNTGAITDDSRE